MSRGHDHGSSLTVVVAGIIVAFTGTSIADPVVSVLIGLLILWSSWDILKESVNVLLKTAPKGLDVNLVERTINDMEGVMAVHDLHVWTIGSGMIAGSSYYCRRTECEEW